MKSDAPFSSQDKEVSESLFLLSACLAALLFIMLSGEQQFPSSPKCQANRLQIWEVKLSPKGQASANTQSHFSKLSQHTLLVEMGCC